MNRTLGLLVAVFLCGLVVPQEIPHRPRILGIEGVTIYVSNVADARVFYNMVLDQIPKHCPKCKQPLNLNISLNRFQSILLSPSPPSGPSNLIAEITFWTDNVTALRSYFVANKIDVSSLGGPQVKYLSVTDPEGHKINFLETDGVLKDPKVQAIQSRGGYEREIIHAGFIVHDRTDVEHFYKDILGLRPYWHGGMKDDQTDWVSMQVPDGVDWLEFMVSVAPDADQRVRGIKNHIAVGTTDIHVTEKKLIENGVKLTEQPKIGRGGKWQLNLYDPDGTRIEFMEFTPTQKPCCSEYTGPHPGQKP
jgi:catechol 2,3-dioxygenase-like lactoylglutathione lyase family enzyme